MPLLQTNESYFISAYKKTLETNDRKKKDQHTLTAIINFLGTRDWRREKTDRGAKKLLCNNNNNLYEIFRELIDGIPFVGAKKRGDIPYVMSGQSY